MTDLSDNIEGDFLHSGITKLILKAYFDVYNTNRLRIILNHNNQCTNNRTV